MSGRDENPGDAPAYTHRPELALSAVLYLMSRFPATRSPAVARSIVEHLDIVCADPRLPQCVRDTASGLASEWQGYAQLADTAPVAATGLQ